MFFDLWKDIYVLLLLLFAVEGRKRKNPEGLLFPPLLGALFFTPAGVDRISTDVHKSRRSSTKQQANQQLHTRNPRNNKELACCSFLLVGFVLLPEVGDRRETTARERHNTNVADASTPQLYCKGGTFAYMRDTGTLSLRHCPHSSAACKANSVNISPPHNSPLSGIILYPRKAGLLSTQTQKFVSSRLDIQRCSPIMGANAPVSEDLVDVGAFSFFSS